MIKLKHLLKESYRLSLKDVTVGDYLLLNTNKRIKIKRITKIDGVPFIIFTPQFTVKTKTGNKMGINMINQKTGFLGAYSDSAPEYWVTKIYKD